MQVPVRILSFLALVGLLAACGGPGAQTLEEKKKLLQSKKSELQALNKVISKLEEEILAADPSAKAAVKTVPVVTTSLSPTTFTHFVEVQGRVEADNMVMVSPQTGGTILSLNAKEGQTVRKGQVLARLDDAIIERNIEELKTQLELAAILYEKQKSLWDQEIGTEVQYLSSKNNKEALERRLATLEEQKALTLVKAPISGTVERVIMKSGELAAPGAPILQLVNNQELSVVAELAENYSPYVRRGDQVKLHFPILNKDLQARIQRVSETINPIDRTFTVEVQLPRNRDFKANMFAEIAINDRTLKDVVTVPVSLVQNSDVGQYVFVAQTNEQGQAIARRVNITTGLSYDNEIVVEEGLSAGDQLITTGFKGLSDGQFISLNDAPIANNR